MKLILNDINIKSNTENNNILNTVNNKKIQKNLYEFNKESYNSCLINVCDDLI